MTNQDPKSSQKRVAFEEPDVSDLVLDTAVCASGEPESETEAGRKMLIPDFIAGNGGDKS